MHSTKHRTIVHTGRFLTITFILLYALSKPTALCTIYAYGQTSSRDAAQSSWPSPFLGTPCTFVCTALRKGDAEIDLSRPPSVIDQRTLRNKDMERDHNPPQTSRSPEDKKLPPPPRRCSQCVWKEPTKSSKETTTKTRINQESSTNLFSAYAFLAPSDRASKSPLVSHMPRKTPPSF
jgi:hypothetical protein